MRKEEKSQRKNKQKHMSSCSVQLLVLGGFFGFWFLFFFLAFTFFHILQMLYKKNMHDFDLQDKKAISGGNRAPLHVIKEEPEFGRGQWRPGPDL